MNLYETKIHIKYLLFFFSVEGQPEMAQNIPTEEIIEVERCDGMILPFDSLTLFASS